MIITVDVLKKVNGAIAEGRPLSLAEMADECALDAKTLELVAGDLSQKITGMSFFFATVKSYLVEMDKRVKKLSDRYREIQWLQSESGVIRTTQEMPDPPIKW